MINNKIFKNIDILVHSVGFQQIINRDISSVSENLRILRSDIKNSCGKLIILFDGYDYDEREVYEIPEIREYVKKLFSSNEDLFYYLSAIENNSNMLLACLSDFEKIRRNESTIIQLRCNPNIIIKQTIINGISSCCNGDEEIISKITSQLFN